MTSFKIAPNWKVAAHYKQWEYFYLRGASYALRHLHINGFVKSTINPPNYNGNHICQTWYKKGYIDAGKLHESTENFSPEAASLKYGFECFVNGKEMYNQTRSTAAGMRLAKYYHDNYQCLLKSPEQETPKMANQLYKVVGKETYGDFLTKNSEGKIVLEIRGSKEVQAFDKSEIEEVRPYTVDINFRYGEHSYSYEAKKGSVSVGDFVIPGTNGSKGYTIGRVTKINTKSAAATRKLEGFNITKGKKINAADA